MRLNSLLAATVLLSVPVACFAFDATITKASPVNAVPTGSVSANTLAPIDSAGTGNVPPPKPYVYEQVRVKSVAGVRSSGVPVPIPRPDPVLGCLIQW